MQRSRTLVAILLAIGCGRAAPAQSQDQPALAAPEAERVANAASGAEPDETPPPPGKFKIRLSRRVQVGQRQHLHRTVTDLSTQRVLRDGKVTKDQTTRALLELDAESEVLAVTSAGQPKSTRYRVKRFTAQKGNSRVDVIQPGTTLTITRGADRDGTVQASSGPLNETEAWAVKTVLSLRLSRADDQRLFGTDAPKAPGESWPMNAGLMAAELRDAGLSVEPAALRGSSTLVSERTLGEERCLEIVARMTADPASLDDLPADARVLSSRVSAHFAGCYPLDPKLPVLTDKLGMSMAFVVEAKDAKGPFRLEIESERNRDTNYSAR